MFIDYQKIQKKFVIGRTTDSIYLVNNTGYEMKNLNLLRSFLNCALCEQFGLTICPAHEGGVMGDKLELVNMSPLGLKNNLIGPPTSKAKEVLAFYENLLTKIVIEGAGGGEYPCLLFTELKPGEGSLEVVLRRIHASFLCSFSSENENAINLLLRTMERILKESRSLLAPHVVGVINYVH